MRRKTFVKKFSQDILDILVSVIKSNFKDIFKIEQPKNEYELARFRSINGTLVIYKTGKLVLSHFGLDRVEDFLISLGKDQEKEYDILIGVDETGKGELFGGIIVCGVIIESSKREIEKEISSFNTKNKTNFERYEELLNNLKALGVKFIIKEIQPAEILPKKTNKILLKTYISIIEELKLSIPHNKSSRVVLDDFGMTHKDKEFIKGIYSFSKVIIEHKADDNYLECKTASLISKYYRERFIQKINKEYSIDGIQPGSGNLSDPNTKEWLRRWVALEGTIPPFVKRWKNVISKILNE